MSKTEPDSLPKAKVDEFVRLLSENERHLYAYILSMVPNWTDADEIAQQVRIRLWEQYANYDTSKAFGSWSRTIAHYLVKSHWTTSKRRPHAFSNEFLDTVSAAFAETDDEVDQRREFLRCCMQQISEANRRLLRRYYGGQEDRREIAASLGRTYDALRQTAHRLRSFLMKCIDEEQKREGVS